MAQLKVSVDTTGRTGMLAKHVTIYSNDGVTPMTTVTVRLSIAAGTAGAE
jgi:hypothetical protein